MSLLRIRRERKEQAKGPSRPPALWKLIAALIIVAVLIWYLAHFG
ncbi:MAG TPA: hypothetical protein VJ957_05300 [Longimicrobiales bacterium]|nr:hypothetical protein [Longimicrobiales bacterium]